MKDIEKFALRITSEQRKKIESTMALDNSKSMNAFVNNAIDFYAEYLHTNRVNSYLPKTLKSYVDGRIGQLEDRLSSMAFRQTVEMDIIAGILASAYKYGSDDLRYRRAQSVKNVKATNGHMTFEERVQAAGTYDDEYEDS